MKFRLLAIVVVLFNLFQLVQAQSPDDVRAVVQSKLQEILGREFVVLQFTFEGATWTDSSLGCPAPQGGIYAPGEVPGYRWSFLLDDGLRYAVHSDATGAQVILCTTDSAPEITYSTHVGTYFTINHPNLWSAQRVSETQVDFAFRGQTGCALPGMQVFIFPDYASATAAQDQQLPPETLKTPLLDYGIYQIDGTSATYTIACENTQRTFRSTSIEAGNGFLILQWSPTAPFPIWNKAFEQILNTFQPSETSLPSSAPPVVEPTALPETALLPAPPPAPVIDLTTIPIAHVFVGDVYIGRINDLPGFNLSFDSTVPRDMLRLAPQTGRLAYVENHNRLFVVSDITTGVHTTVTAQMSILPPAWAADGTKLAFAIPGGDEGTFDVYEWLPDETQNVLGAIEFNTDCETPTSNYVVDQLYWQETGFNGNPLFFEWLPDGRFLFSTNCTGVGLTLWNPADSQLVEFEDLSRPHLNPDRSKVAGIRDQEIVVIDLATAEEQVITPTQTPDQMGWDITGTQIFYSTLAAQDPVVWNDPASEGRVTALFGVFPFESRVNTLRVFQIDLNNGAEVQRWEGNGFAIGRLLGAPDGSGLLMTLIPSDRQMLTNYVNGEITNVILNSVPETQLYWLPTDGSEAKLLAITGEFELAH